MSQRMWSDDPGKVLRQAANIVQSGAICDECLGRAFAQLGHGLANSERGKSLRIILSMLGIGDKAGSCWICEGFLRDVDSWASRAVALSSGIKFDSYLFGVKLSPRLIEMERLFSERFCTNRAESLKHAINRRIGKAFEAQVAHGTLDIEKPHLSFVIDLVRNTIELRVLSLFIYGRYQKLTRGIPQTRWPCRHCRGKGCDHCNFTGKQYEESVEELMEKPFLDAAGSNSGHLHGAGREDIDARMLGSGRPFVLEVCSPRRRKLDLVSLQAEVNKTQGGKIRIGKLKFVSRMMVSKIKEIRAAKTYEALVSFEGDISSGSLREALCKLVGEIKQRTPQRVVHRRADLTRTRRIHEIGGELVSPHQANITVKSEGGLYIKELVSGDNGRTAPSLASCLGIAAHVIALDVVEVTSSLFPY
ncbi:tRNA pseudouridine(54/55) synthase Pus10 [Candidatus Bipolaricaulota bacterium]|nr:tRNA pseudouridine(54/55) synthase Pus10 [Candidatus Bipolaricaulota bacterium]